MRGLWAAVLVMSALAGCGGDGGSSSGDDARLGDRPAPDAGPTLVAALGDSITAGSPLWDPSPVIREQLGSTLDRRSQYEYWAARRLEDVRFRNCGVFGERTDEIAARFDACVGGADVLIVQGGINDVAQRRPVQEAAANLRGMVERGQESGLRVALVEVLPWNNGHPAAAEPIDELNRLIGEIGSELDVPVYPWYEALEDPAAPGRMRAGLTMDGDHPSVAGYRRLAESVELP